MLNCFFFFFTVASKRKLACSWNFRDFDHFGMKYHLERHFKESTEKSNSLDLPPHLLFLWNKQKLLIEGFFSIRLILYYFSTVLAFWEIPKVCLKWCFQRKGILRQKFPSSLPPRFLFVLQRLMFKSLNLIIRVSFIYGCNKAHSSLLFWTIENFKNENLKELTFINIDLFI